MRVVLQRVTSAEVMVGEDLVGKIGVGFLLLVGIAKEDTMNQVLKMAKKIATLRIFEDENGKMNLGLSDVNGEILSISQFTLYADIKKGRRPGFERAAYPAMAEQLYQMFNEELKKFGFTVETGRFKSDMNVRLVNDGPVTIVMDTDDWM